VAKPLGAYGEKLIGIIGFKAVVWPASLPTWEPSTRYNKFNSMSAVVPLT
jgi:hypothetical protein